MILYRIQSIPWSSYKIYDNQKEKICSWKYWKFYFRFECIPSKYVKISLIFWDFLKGLYTRYRRSLGWRWITTGTRWYPAITMSSRSFPSARVQYNWWRCLQWWRWGFWSVWGGWRQFCSTCLRSYGLTFFCRQKKRWWQPKFNPKTDKFPLWDQNFNEKNTKIWDWILL